MREPVYKLRSVGLREKIEKKERKKNVTVETPKKKKIPTRISFFSCRIVL